MKFANNEDREKAYAYMFARGAELMMSEEILASMRADLPAGTPIEVEEISDGWVSAKVTEPVDVPEPQLSGPRTVDTGRYDVRHDWPADASMSAGRRGLVLGRSGDHYTTAYFEATLTEPATFLRGEAETIEAAEDAAWAKYLRYTANDHEHRFETRGYVNGAGFCVTCGLFKSKAFTLQEIGSVCGQCGADMYVHIGDQMFCKEHAPDRDEERRLRDEARKTGKQVNPLEDLLAAASDDS